MNEQEMNRLIEEWNSKHPSNKAAPQELLHENEKQELIWCEEEQEWFPFYTMEERDSGTIVYKLNTEQNFTYNGVFSDKTEKAEIGYYGRKWQEFMEENYPNEILTMGLNSLTFGEMALAIDKEANELYNLLDKQYCQANPRPTTFLGIAKWEKMKQLEIDHEVMEQVVLQYRS